MKTKDAVSFFGTKIALARALGLNKSAISQWGDEVPLLRQYELERITDGKLQAVDRRRASSHAA